jgi:hypothetical protein
MKIRLADADQLSELLHFLRERGCIAYAAEAGDVIEAIRPHAFGAQEEAEIRELVEIWQREHPDAEVSVD